MGDGHSVQLDTMAAIFSSQPPPLHKLVPTFLNSSNWDHFCSSLQLGCPNSWEFTAASFSFLFFQLGFQFLTWEELHAFQPDLEAASSTKSMVYPQNRSLSVGWKAWQPHQRFIGYFTCGEFVPVCSLQIQCFLPPLAHHNV